MRQSLNKVQDIIFISISTRVANSLADKSDISGPLKRNLLMVKFYSINHQIYGTTSIVMSNFILYMKDDFHMSVVIL